ncbi:SDR family oxidoreductase [Blastococcus sp. KM273128]|uniref:SDR family oxidoreductase n=1 Tax=Blastococcus sp. KM273128 TaxID=2570314 RepID=UPI001F48D4C3|nr:SDR family oxidoreductase [Blastococcus sp. KM273128]MCF6743122.1 SDR family oxidoreductase [Blastococcus sp. KM273128]
MARTVLVTGVSRRAGIGFAVARRLLADGHRVVVHSWSAHDAEQPWGADDVDAVLAELGRPPHVAADLADPAAPAELISAARSLVGPVDALVANHARSSSGGLQQVTAAELDRSWAVNARATVLLVQGFAAQHRRDRGRGAVVLMTSGQHRGAMPGELAYVLSKGAVQQVTATLGAELAVRDIGVVCVNPGPVDTGYADDATRAAVAARFPSGHWPRPGDTAEIVAWLTGPAAMALTGTTIDAEHGFHR